MPINLSRFSSIGDHLVEKVRNHSWLSFCLEGKADAFPHRIVDGGKSRFSTMEYVPEDFQSHLPTRPRDNDEAAYVFNIPMAFRALQREPELFSRILELIKKQAFGETASASKAIVRQRVAVVIGINAPFSIDSSVNRELSAYMSRVPLVEDIAYRTFGFHWKPQTVATKDGMYPPGRGYLLLKALSEESARAVRELFEGIERMNPALRSQISYQRVRDQILQSRDTEFFVDWLSEDSEGPVYLATADADTKGFRSSRYGVLNYVDAAVSNENVPSAITFGYTLDEPKTSLLTLAARIDMAVRAAMSEVVPYSAYFPEPGSFFCIRKPGEDHHLDQMSFLGKGMNLESRRLIQNGLKTGALDTRIYFGAAGGVVTETPARMKTGTTAIKNLTPSQLKQKTTLSALRGISQTHLFPKEWADNLYAALGFSGGAVVKVTAPMMHIFGVFDPISRMFSVEGRYSSSVFDRVMRDYSKPLTDVQKDILKSARGKLIALGMPKEKIDLVERAARESGKAIHKVLQEFISGG